MSTLVVEGGRRLEGVVRVGGNKNAALPLIAACLLTDRPCTLHNVPSIRDVESLIELLRGVGAEVQVRGTHTLAVHAARVTGDRPNPELVGRLRGSVLLLGPLLARLGRVALARPGGDFPSRRSLSMHVAALCKLGARHERHADEDRFSTEGLRGGSIYLDEASVTGTETALLAAAGADGTTTIRHAACEPHVVELCEFIAALGAPVEGAGTPTIAVTGPVRRNGAEHTIRGDYIEAGSWAAAAAMTGGALGIEGVREADFEPVARVLERFGVSCAAQGDRFLVEVGALRAAGRVVTGIWPGFPSDLISLIAVLATQAEGQTLLHDWMYELRLFALEQLSGMGANLFLCDPHRVIVTGRSRLNPRVLDSRDLRSGMALIVAALAAAGTSRLAHVEVVERGYEDLEPRLRSLGARVWREK